jgi:hypothetical protein
VSDETKQKPWYLRTLVWSFEKVAAHVLEYVLSLVAFGSLAALAFARVRRWLTGIWTWMGQKQSVFGWEVVTIVAADIVLAAAVAVVWVKFRNLKRIVSEVREPINPAQTPPFKPIRVDDEKLNLRWTLQERPQSWLKIPDIRRGVTPAYARQILDGPFHSECGERLGEADVGNLMEPPRLMDKCPGCEKVVFRTAGRTMAYLPDVYQVRAQALMELQRMHRNGVDIAGTRLTLQQPLYWKDIFPAI